MTPIWPVMELGSTLVSSGGHWSMIHTLYRINIQVNGQHLPWFFYLVPRTDWKYLKQLFYSYQMWHNLAFKMYQIKTMEIFFVTIWGMKICNIAEKIHNLLYMWIIHVFCENCNFHTCMKSPRKNLITSIVIYTRIHVF